MSSGRQSAQEPTSKSSLLVPTISCIVVTLSWLSESTEMERVKSSFKPSLPRWRGQKVKGKVLSIILISAIAGAVVALGYVITAPNVGEKSTGFYILGLEGKAQNYPTELMVGQEGRVIVGVINHEYEEVTYRIKITIDGVENSEIEPVILGHNEKWEKVVSFAPIRVGDNKRVEFLLYRLDQNDVYQRLHLWIDVKE